ncbi:MAG TPA: TraR/DksA C4-type zinc finger protein [Gemmataceae bacterium]|nr:TraR/DksA C4-type zinc finger protein [Gemmataceae bacterium]
MLNKNQLEKFRRKLHDLRAGFDARVDSIRDEAAHAAGGEASGGLSNTPIHLGDLGSQEEGAAVNVGLAENEAYLRQEIDEALRRLEDGTYGTCEACHKDINPSRLDAVPYSRWCIQCAEANQTGPR